MEIYKHAPAAGYDLVIENLDEFAYAYSSSCYICDADYVVRTPVSAAAG